MIPIDVLEKLLREGLLKNKSVTISTSGYSMTPLIYPGEPLKVCAHPIGKFKKGDIVLLRNTKGFIIHRIWEIKKEHGGRFITKGDANLHVDPPVEADQIIGKVVSKGNSILGLLWWYIVNLGTLLAMQRLDSYRKTRLPN